MSFLTVNPVIETERLTLRAPRPEDAAPYVAMFQTDRVKFMSETLDEFGAWKAWYTEMGHWAQRGYGMFAVFRRGEDTPLGIVGPWYPHTWPEREIGWMVYPGAEGQGIAYEAAVATRAWAYRELGWDSAVSFIDPDNARSIALAERMGAVLDTQTEGPDRLDLVYRHPGPEAV